MATAVARQRTFPFREHRSMAEVYETEALLAHYRQSARYMETGAKKRLQALLGRVVLPPEDPPQRTA